MGLASFEHRFCSLLVERHGRNNGAPLFSRNLGEGLSADQLALARLEIHGGDSTAETASIPGYAFLNGAWEDIGHYGLGAPALDPLLVEHFLEVLDGVLTSQEGKEIVGELMEGHSISKVMSRANEQIELALQLTIVKQRGCRIGRDWRRGNGIAREDEIGNAVIGQRPGSVEIGVNEF